MPGWVGRETLHCVSYQMAYLLSYLHLQLYFFFSTNWKGPLGSHLGLPQEDFPGKFILQNVFFYNRDVWTNQCTPQLIPQGNYYLSLGQVLRPPSLDRWEDITQFFCIKPETSLSFFFPFLDREVENGGTFVSEHYLCFPLISSV